MMPTGAIVVHARHRMQVAIGVVILCFSLLSQAAQPTAPDVKKLYDTFRELYDAQEYEQAIEALNKLPTKGAGYFYDLGILHFRQNQFGKSVAFFKKAHRMAPSDEDIRFNLALAEKKLSANLGNPNLDPASSWLERVGDSWRLGQAQGILGLIALILIAWVMKRYLKNRSLSSLVTHPISWATAVTLALMVLLGIAKWRSAAAPLAIVVEESTLRSGPGDQFLKLGSLSPGVQVRISGGNPSQKWHQVRYRNDEVGWLPDEVMLRL